MRKRFVKNLAFSLGVTAALAVGLYFSARLYDAHPAASILLTVLLTVVAVAVWCLFYLDTRALRRERELTARLARQSAAWRRIGEAARAGSPAPPPDVSEMPAPQAAPPPPQAAEAPEAAPAPAPQPDSLNDVLARIRPLEELDATAAGDELPDGPTTAELAAQRATQALAAAREAREAAAKSSRQEKLDRLWERAEAMAAELGSAIPTAPAGAEASAPAAEQEPEGPPPEPVRISAAPIQPLSPEPAPAPDGEPPAPDAGSLLQTAADLTGHGEDDVAQRYARARAEAQRFLAQRAQQMGDLPQAHEK